MSGVASVTVTKQAFWLASAVCIRNCRPKCLDVVRRAVPTVEPGSESAKPLNSVPKWIGDGMNVIFSADRAALVRRGCHGRGRRCLVRYMVESAEHNAGSAGHFIQDFERRDESAHRDRSRRC